MPPSINITISFDKKLQEITGKPEFTTIASQNAPFIFILDSVFSEYPEIMEKYKPGQLGFSVNGLPPKEYSPLLDGDVIHFQVM